MHGVNAALVTMHVLHKLANDNKDQRKATRYLFKKPFFFPINFCTISFRAFKIAINN